MFKGSPVSIDIEDEEIVSAKERAERFLTGGDHYNFCLAKWAMLELGNSGSEDLASLSGEKAVKILDSYFRCGHFIEFIVVAGALKKTGRNVDICLDEKRRASIDLWQRGQISALKTRPTPESYFYCVILSAFLKNLGFCPEPLILNNAVPHILEFIKEQRNLQRPELVLAAKAALKAAACEGIVIY